MSLQRCGAGSSSKADLMRSTICSASSASSAAKTTSTDGPAGSMGSSGWPAFSRAWLFAIRRSAASRMLAVERRFSSSGQPGHRWRRPVGRPRGRLAEALLELARTRRSWRRGSGRSTGRRRRPRPRCRACRARGRSARAAGSAPCSRPGTRRRARGGTASGSAQQVRVVVEQVDRAAAAARRSRAGRGRWSSCLVERVDLGLLLERRTSNASASRRNVCLSVVGEPRAAGCVELVPADGVVDARGLAAGGPVGAALALELSAGLPHRHASRRLRGACAGRSIASP